jgi:hypothetical protein
MGTPAWTKHEQGGELEIAIQFKIWLGMSFFGIKGFLQSAHFGKIFEPNNRNVDSCLTMPRYAQRVPIMCFFSQRNVSESHSDKMQS